MTFTYKARDSHNANSAPATVRINVIATVQGVGYWTNHPEAWCQNSISLGCTTYSKSQAIAIMKQSTSADRTYALAAELAAAKLNVNCRHTKATCVSSAISAASSWLCSHPIGSKVGASSPAWNQIKSTYDTLVNYNAGRLCAPAASN